MPDKGNKRAIRSVNGTSVDSSAVVRKSAVPVKGNHRPIRSINGTPVATGGIAEETGSIEHQTRPHRSDCSTYCSSTMANVYTGQVHRSVDNN